MARPAPLLAELGSGAIDEHEAHRTGGDPGKVEFVSPPLLVLILAIDQAQVRLLNQLRRLQRLVAVLTVHQAARDAAEVLIDVGEQFFASRGFASRAGAEQAGGLGDVVGHGGSSPGRPSLPRGRCRHTILGQDQDLGAASRDRDS
jgi:hypothetical protein